MMRRDDTNPISASEHDKVIECAPLNYLKHMVTLQNFLITYIFKSKAIATTYFLCCQVFVLVNANKKYWIPFNVNRPNRRIQIFDSFGSIMERPELQVTVIT
jgi:hypothetical protein